METPTVTCLSSSQTNCCVQQFNPYMYPNQCRGCNTNLASSNPPSIYQKQKIIQGTVRVASSNYTMNLGALQVYQKPTKEYDGVNWRQFSDRKIPHIQTAVVASHTNSVKHSKTWHRPTCQSPGGVGVDQKHGSYDRYLARLKGKGPLRRGVIKDIVPEIPFNLAFPVYGGKTFKTSIVSGYYCPDDCVLNNDNNINGNNEIYNNSKFKEQNIYGNGTAFQVGDYVAVNDGVFSCFKGAVILEILENKQYVVKLDTGVITTQSADNLFIYPRCITTTTNCNQTAKSLTGGCPIPTIGSPYVSAEANTNLYNCRLTRYTEGGVYVL